MAPRYRDPSRALVFSLLCSPLQTPIKETNILFKVDISRTNNHDDMTVEEKYCIVSKNIVK